MTSAIFTNAPGRVNLLGEHTDYTGGLVLPMAIPFATKASVTAAAEGYVFTSTAFPGEHASSRDEKAIGAWSDYPAGVLHELWALGMDVPPFRMELDGNVPLGAGLSSSASIEVATAVALLRHAGTMLETKEIALLCQRAENRFVGSPCGIMDQFVVTAATAGHALLLNTRTLTYELLPMNTGNLAQCSIVIANSMVRHSVATGDYGVRRRELEEGQAIIRTRFPEAEDLGRATTEQLEAVRASLSNNVYKRCKHVITENARVREAEVAMKAGDAVKLGELMNGSHASQRDDFEDSVAEIDFLAATAITLPGCYGARLTGGGFGGCTVSLVASDAVPQFTAQLAAAYKDHFNIEAEIYVCTPADGALAQLERAQ
ncbi:galactokinase [Terriglobus sp. RCC_193]|uniref:galactokinase n=1 Tax=Terriglobus sp. RCC_193 TaxID=3239218 RepID=UPI00352437DE